ncbi:MAG: hypothetical protein KC925_03965 [Candidatus Doudnabacteria bacterium]|nr:hypothetical protein [Candidatus Doudnabacteria bacterium]
MKISERIADEGIRLDRFSTELTILSLTAFLAVPSFVLSDLGGSLVGRPGLVSVTLFCLSIDHYTFLIAGLFLFTSLVPFFIMKDRMEKRIRDQRIENLNYDIELKRAEKLHQEGKKSEALEKNNEVLDKSHKALLHSLNKIDYLLDVQISLFCIGVVMTLGLFWPFGEYTFIASLISLIVVLSLLILRSRHANKLAQKEIAKKINERRDLICSIEDKGNTRSR